MIPIETRDCAAEAANAVRVSRMREQLPPLLTHLKMTTPYERTRAVVQARELLDKLASHDAPVNHHELQDEAIRLLRHYPLDVDLELSSAALPGVWGSLREI